MNFGAVVQLHNTREAKKQLKDTIYKTTELISPLVETVLDYAQLTSITSSRLFKPVNDLKKTTNEFKSIEVEYGSCVTTRGILQKPSKASDRKLNFQAS